MSTLPDFSVFFHSLWGYAPFPWQVRLANALTHRAWPSWITLPTGTGKTSAIDIAVYHLATQATLSPQERTAPVRIVFAVNRRIVVDEAFERAKKIADRLKSAISDSTSPLQPFALALVTLSESHDGVPLEAYPLRGATFTDHSWARTPTQPVVIATTLDQLGSRMLFRGYGVSEFARSIHAGLLANDALLILDEAHTSKAFSDTLASIEVLRGNAIEPLRSPFKTVQLTATPPVDASDLFTLGDQDLANPVIHARLNSHKPTELVRVADAVKSHRHEKLADAIGAKAVSMLGLQTRRILIVVNRVATATLLHKNLSKLKANGKHCADVELLTGRLRPLDRDALIKRIVSRHELQSGNPSPEVLPLILIATQCIEVGADFDFDALLTELAPLDSLRQRFGRLNRYGRNIDALAAIFAPEEALDVVKSDPLYLDCLPKVWAWLESLQSPLPFGISELEPFLPMEDRLSCLLSPSAEAPVLLPSHLDLLCQTSPVPHLTPDPSVYIHGQGRDFPEVTVVLRADLDDEAVALDVLRSTPPVGAEGATIPLHLARAWILDALKVRDESGDIPASTIGPDLKWDESTEIRCYRWAEGESSRVLAPNDLQNGDVLVLPASLDINLLRSLVPLPDGLPWELDQFEHAYLLSRDRLALRLHPLTIAAVAKLLPEKDRLFFESILRPLELENEDGSDTGFCEKDWITALMEISGLVAINLPEDHHWKTIWDRVATVNRSQDWKAAPHPLGGAIFQNKTRVGYSAWPLDPEDLGAQSQDTDEKVLLSDHSYGVSVRSERHARSLGLPDTLVSALRDAGLWHDLGKLDPRFQSWLHGCSIWSVGSKPFVAKSGGFRPQAINQLLREGSGLPQGFRHELLSALIVLQSEAGVAHPSIDLILHLIASHHGRCRALAPVVIDGEPEPFDVVIAGETLRFPGSKCPLGNIGDRVAGRFWSLTRRYGWWGLPYLETLLRLADQQESAKPHKVANL